MQFIVIAYDDTDEGALQRRLAVREDHLKTAKEMFDSGKWLYAAGILNDDGVMIGSMIVCEFPTRDELEQQWLKEEPYIIGNVWKKIDIYRTQVAPFCVNK
ncbi:MAG: hypothetical protein JSV84_14975 [Gemmatimonadota bacterium]|nr:MAG: hypothetical protein JSV84_14975 [Gemmatimonadota bacterium]